jgi:hypothetical protein
MRTITFTEPTKSVPNLASILTSALLLLGRPNFPATKKGTEVPLIGTVNVSVFANAPVVPLRKTTAPPEAAEVLERRIVTVGVIAPEGFVTRIRHGEGVHDTNCALGFMLLLICNSTFMWSFSFRGDSRT